MIVGTLVVCLGWVLVSKYAAAELIRSAYHGSSWPFFNRLITGQATYSLSDYLNRWSAFAWDMLFALLLAGLLTALAAWPKARNAFWGKEPVFCPPLETKPPMHAMRDDNIEPSWRGKLSDFAHSRNMAYLFWASIVLALLLRLLLLGAKSFSEDEMFSFAIAHTHLLGFWDMVTHQEANMVLYYLILHFWIHIGQSEFAIRSLSVLLAVATVPILYYLGARTFGHKVGMLGALLLAINGFHIEFSQDARSYSLFVFLVTLSSWFFLQCVHEGSRRNWTRYILAISLAVYTHLFGVLVLAAHWISLVFLPRDRVPWRRMIPSTAAIGFLALPMEIYVLRGNHHQLNWVQRTSLQDVYKLFTSLAGQPARFSPLGYGALLLLLVCSISVINGILPHLQLRSWSKGRAETWYLAFFLTWLLVPILLTLAISVWEPAFAARFLIICLPPFILLVSYGISRLQWNWLVVAFLLLIAGLTAHGLLPYYHSPGEDWKGAAHYVFSHYSAKDAATFSPRYFEGKFEFYFLKEPGLARISRPPLALLIPSSDTFGPFLRSLPSHYDRVWLVTRTKPHINTVVLQKHFIEASVGTEFPAVPKIKKFSGGLEVVLFSKENPIKIKATGKLISGKTASASISKHFSSNAIHHGSQSKEPERR